ncbi:UDP-2,3-diacylglucosamine diphosphatase LpxI [Rhizobiaceae bacterium BDR2-2]|uniref:UDP-2,3-diacylglucosamine diphosphatase LpxI n=1 Tax=Ectorhizobium quercum TaxID=2965071 RepID=A0AAE3MYZ5_9HYPH|nr:UDP-2,3-diacylglucosamine diphosphatase LpxI [Ectorhizobium quercum]MCX8997633.1 UDP-2,3-diacylglucosamine diphosphatase LpxI [Ectorhizobium quercum]
MSGGAGFREGRLAIIAGGGRLPHDIAEAARGAGEDPFIVLLSGEADRDWSGFEHATVSVGDIAAVSALLRGKNLKRVVLSGSVKRRPEWRHLRPTLSSVVKLPSIVRTLFSGGDDTVLRMVIDLLEGEGCRIVGAQEIVPNLLATLGPLGRHAPSGEDLRDIAAGVAAADVLGALDIGQGAVAVGGRVVAVEGAEGTDSMLLRVAGLRAEGRISKRRRGVLVKLCKPQQDVRADLPTIGRSTVENAGHAGLAGIAVEAGRSLVLERDALVKAADEAGLFVIGIERAVRKDAT